MTVKNSMITKDKNDFLKSFMTVIKEEERVITYLDFFKFLVRNKVIRNLIPSYVFTGMFYGFW
jgi:hypothetical protein